MPMKQTFLAKAAELLRASMRRKRWYRVCTGLAAAVVFVTTYMLILPAITLSNDQGWTVPLGVDLSVEPDYTATLTLADGSEVTIGVYDPDGHVPEGAELSAELYEEGGEQYLQAESDLWEYGEVTGYDGMMAMDIHFADAEGNEVEPTGAVYVDLRALLPENVDPDSVAVQHHVTKESEGLFGWVSGEITRLDVVADSSEETGEIEVTPPTEEVQPPVEDETQEPPVEGETQEPPTEEDVQEPPVEDGTQQPAEDAEDTESDVELPDGDTPTTDTPAGETPETKPEPSTPDVSSPDTGASSDSGTDTGASSDSQRYGYRCFFRQQYGQQCFFRQQYGQQCFFRRQYGQQCFFRQRHGYQCFFRQRHGQQCFFRQRHGQQCFFRQQHGYRRFF